MGRGVIRPKYPTRAHPHPDVEGHHALSETSSASSAARASPHPPPHEWGGASFGRSTPHARTHTPTSKDITTGRRPPQRVRLRAPHPTPLPMNGEGRHSAEVPHTRAP